MLARNDPLVLADDARTHERTARSLLWLAGLVAAACGFLWQFGQRTDPARARLAAIPLTGENFYGQNIPLSPTEQRVLGRADLVNRRYRFGDRQLFVTVIDGAHDRHAVHDPQYCFQGAGWQVTGERGLVLPGGTGRALHLVRGTESFDALYWFCDGATRYASFPRYWWQTTLRRLTLGQLGSEPVLVVVQDLSDLATPIDPAPLISTLHL